MTVKTMQTAEVKDLLERVAGFDQQGGDDGNQQRGWQPDREKVQKQGFAVLRTWRHGRSSLRAFLLYAPV